MDSTIEVAEQPRPRYQRANAWPNEIPPLTRDEAAKAVQRLWKKFGNIGWTPRLAPEKVRRVWIPAKPPFNTLHRGWRRLVHDMSHRIARHLHPNRPPHDLRHEWLEGEMVEYVLSTDWLQGGLKPKEKPARPAQELRYERVLVRLASWERKAKRAENAIKKLRRQKAYYEKRAA